MPTSRVSIRALLTSFAVVCGAGAACVAGAAEAPRTAPTEPGATVTLRAAPSQAWFQQTEQALMDAVALGDKSLWERVLDPAFVATSEEGEVVDRKALLDSLRGLPPGLSGHIAVRELTVQEFPTFAVVRYLADESEQVFGQRLTTKYRTTDTFRREGDSWKMLASHTSVVTADPPAQAVPAAIREKSWPELVGSYRLLPDGWTLHVELRNGALYGGRDPQKLVPMVPLAPDAFVLSGRLGEYTFVRDETGQVTHILELRKFEPLVWTREAAK